MSNLEGLQPAVVFANNCIIFGYIPEVKLGQITIQQARYCQYYALGEEHTKGFMSLAKHGPNPGSKVSQPVDDVTVDCCCVILATPEAVKVWESSVWK